jgi:methionyl-tRNA synthetase
MRLGVEEFKLPEFIPTRGHLLLHGEKFSKSRGWYVSVRGFLGLFPADYIRYYLASITPYSPSDVNFDWEDFQVKVNNELIANIGNFIHRTLTFTWSNYGGKVPTPRERDTSDKEFEEEIERVASDVKDELEKIELSRGLRRILEFSKICNQYFQHKEPWSKKKQAETCLYLCINAVRSLAILLEPYLPFTTEILWKQLNLQGSIHKQSWASASRLKIEGGHRISKPQIPFKRVEDEKIKKEKDKLLKLATD